MLFKRRQFKKHQETLQRDTRESIYPKQTHFIHRYSCHSEFIARGSWWSSGWRELISINSYVRVTPPKCCSQTPFQTTPTVDRFAGWSGLDRTFRIFQCEWCRVGWSFARISHATRPSKVGWLFLVQNQTRCGVTIAGSECRAKF